MEAAEVSNASDLDKHSLMRGATPARRFQSVEDDGFDPAGIAITKTLSLLDYVCRKKRYSHLRADYGHPLWRTLQDRSWSEIHRERLMEASLQRLGLTLIEAGDARRAKELGLHWRDHFEIEVYDAYVYEYIPTLLSLDDATLTTKWASLDGIQVLILLYRHSLDAGNAKFAGDLRHSLERACRAFGKIWHGEAADTWRYVTSTLALAWIPNYEPSGDAMNKARNQLRKEFESSQPQGRGRRKLAPNQVTQGKVERRWRRRALMRAGVLDEPGRQHYIGFQTSTPFNAWLATNRRLIDARIARAYLRLGLGAKGGKVKDASKGLRSMQIPVDDDHSIIPPYVDPVEEHRFGGSVFELLSIEPTKIRGSGKE